MKKIPMSLTFSSESGKKITRSSYILDISPHNLNKIKLKKPSTHHHTFSENVYKLGHNLCKPVIFMCFIFLLALFPNSARALENPGFLSSLFLGPKIFAYPARFLIGGLSFLGLIFTLLTMGLPGKLMKFAANYHQPDVSYLAAAEQEDKENKESAELLRINTFNAGLTPPIISYIYNELREPEIRAKELVMALERLNEAQHPNIFCLQEVFAPETTHILCDYFRNRNYHLLYNIAPSEGSFLRHGSFIPKWVGTNSGLFFASKFPIVCMRFIEFYNSFYHRKEDSVANKGFLMVVIRKTDKDKQKKDHYYLICNTHLQCRAGQSFEKVRTEQLTVIHQVIQEYQAYIKQTLKLDLEDTIISGDFNISNFHEGKYGKKLGERVSKVNEFFFKEYQENPLDKEKPTATWTIPHPISRHTASRGIERFPDPNVNYDFILHQRNAKSLVYKREYILELGKKGKSLSDHLPVVAEFASI